MMSEKYEPIEKLHEILCLWRDTAKKERALCSYTGNSITEKERTIELLSYDRAAKFIESLRPTKKDSSEREGE